MDSPMVGKALYTHGDGRQEVVFIKARHPECDALTVFVPSLNRERQTTAARLKPLIETEEKKVEVESLPGTVTAADLRQDNGDEASPEREESSLPDNADVGTAAAGILPEGALRDTFPVVEIAALDTLDKASTEPEPAPKSFGGGAKEEWIRAQKHSTKNSPHSWDSVGIRSEPMQQANKRSTKDDVESKKVKKTSRSSNRRSQESSPAPPSVYSYHMSMPQALPQINGRTFNTGHQPLDLNYASVAGNTVGNTVPSNNGFQEIGSSTLEYEDPDGNRDRSARRIKRYTGVSVTPGTVNVTTALNGSDGSIDPNDRSDRGLRSRFKVFSNYGSYGTTSLSSKAGYRSLHAVPEDSTQDQELLEDIHPRYTGAKAVDLLCNPTTCCSIS